MDFKWFRFMLEETKLIRSPDGLLNFVNKFPYFLPRLTGSYLISKSTPWSLQIEPTNYCNINCICCSRDKMKRDLGHMNLNLFRRIIDDAANCKMMRVYLYLHGEPLLHPDVVEMIRYVKAKKMALTLTTNGMLLNEEKMADILNSGINNADHFIFSVLGYSRKTHERIMRGVIHEQVTGNIQSFLELRKSFKVNGPIIETIMYVMPENKSEEKSFVKHWRGIVDHVREPGAITAQFSEVGSREESSVPFRHKVCRIFKERMTILWNGDVTLCCADLEGEYTFGNIKEKSISEILNSDKMVYIRNLHKERNFKKIPLCAKCDW